MRTREAQERARGDPRRLLADALVSIDGLTFSMRVDKILEDAGYIRPSHMAWSEWMAETIIRGLPPA